MGKALFISIKPEFADKIADGTKTIELRKQIPNINEDSLVVIYSTSPVMSIIATGRIDKIIKSSPGKLWKDYSNEMGIDKKRYLEYFDGKDLAVGIVLKEVKKRDQIISLRALRSKSANFNPPQSFRYFDTTEITRFIGRC